MELPAPAARDPRPRPRGTGPGRARAAHLLGRLFAAATAARSHLAAGIAGALDRRTRPRRRGVRGVLTRNPGGLSGHHTRTWNHPRFFETLCDSYLERDPRPVGRIAPALSLQLRGFS